MNKNSAIVLIVTVVMLTAALLGVVSVLPDIVPPPSNAVVISPDTLSGTVTSYTNEFGDTITLNRIIDWETNVMCYMHIVNGEAGEQCCYPIIPGSEED